MSFDVRPCADLDEFQQAFLAIGQYFGAEPDDESNERFAQNLPLERMHAARDNGTIIGGAGAFPFTMTVPGARVACAGVTVVGVYPTHRRRGVLRAMMKAQLEDARERGEPIAALWASEETIYGRFGYGLASFAGTMKVPREYSAYAVPLERTGRLRIADVEEARPAVAAVWDQVRAERPGMFARTANWWEFRVFLDPPERREGAGPKRVALLEHDGEPTAYAIYRHRPGWEDGVSNAALVVIEALGATPQATAEIWRYLLDIDWVATIEAELLPVDHPLLLLLATPRRAQFRIGDGIWVRLVDVRAALSARTYAADDTLVFEVRDAFCPWNEGRWRLADGEALPTDEEPDLCLNADALGSAYLGGVSFAELRRGLRLEEVTPGAAERADALFRTAAHPWCPEIF